MITTDNLLHFVQRYSSVLLLVMGLNGCISTVSDYEVPYVESVSSILVTEDGRNLVFIGQTYHYIFDVPPMLVKTLNGSFHQAITANISRFYVNPDGKINGSFVMQVMPEATDADKASALESGYRKRGNQISYSSRLSGIRYQSAGIAALTTTQQLNKTYSVEVLVRKSDSKIAFENIMSPIKKIIESEKLSLGPAPLLPLRLKMHCNSCKDCSCNEKRAAK